MTAFAEKGIIVLFFVALCIHLLVIFKWIPYTFVWGGRLKSDKEMYRFESVSIILNLFFLWIMLEKVMSLSGLLPEKIINIVIWIMAIIFALNTIGNLASKNKFEKFVFTPLTLIMTIFCLIILLN